MDRLQRVQNAAVRLLSGAKKYYHITPIMKWHSRWPPCLRIRTYDTLHTWIELLLLSCKHYTSESSTLLIWHHISLVSVNWNRLNPLTNTLMEMEKLANTGTYQYSTLHPWKIIRCYWYSPGLDTIIPSWMFSDLPDQTRQIRHHGMEVIVRSATMETFVDQGGHLGKRCSGIIGKLKSNVDFHCKEGNSNQSVSLREMWLNPM